MDLTPRWRKTGEPVKPRTFALMVLLPFLLAAGFMVWVFGATAGDVQKKNGALRSGSTHAVQDR